MPAAVPALVITGTSAALRTPRSGGQRDGDSTYAYVNPVVAVALGWLLLGERFTLTTMLGGAVVLVSVVLLLTSRSRRAA